MGYRFRYREEQLMASEAADSILLVIAQILEPASTCLYNVSDLGGYKMRRYRRSLSFWERYPRTALTMLGTR